MKERVITVRIRLGQKERMAKLIERAAETAMTNEFQRFANVFGVVLKRAEKIVGAADLFLAVAGLRKRIEALEAEMKAAGYGKPAKPRRLT